MRPSSYQGNFWWEGFDGSKILAHGILGGYNTLKGQAAQKVDRCIQGSQDTVGLCLWGIGNHGGGPSKIDLQNIEDYIKNSDVEIVHSYAENYFAELDKSNLSTRSTSLIPSMVGCYTSMVKVKQANRRLENKIALTEKIMAYADLTRDLQFGEQELMAAKKALALCQFHDMLPGSGIKSVEEDTLRTLSYGEEIADRLYTRCFFKMCEGQKKAEPGTIPIMVFNPHPYEIDGEFEVGFMLENQNWNEDEATLATVYDEVGNQLPTQNEKPDCTFNLDWIQKVSFCGKIAPSSITRFNCKLRVVRKGEIAGKEYDAEKITVRNERMDVVICRKTGRILHYAVEGKVLIRDSGVLEVYKDNEDPWGMTVTGFSDYEDAFQLMSMEEANEFAGYPEEKIPAVRVVEDGDVRLRVQSFWKYKASKAVVEYTIPKGGIYMDVCIRLYSNEPNKMIKFRIDSAFAGVPYGQTAFGQEELCHGQNEAVFHKWCMLKGDEQALAVYNNGLYGGSFTDRSIRLSLLRTPVYAAHPIGKRQIAPHDRFLEHIDMGERIFTFRISNADNLERNAQIYNEAPQLLSFFPSGDGQKKGSVILIDNPDIILSSMRKAKGKYILTLFNSSDKHRSATITLRPKQKTIIQSFRKYEIKILELE